MTRMDTQSNQSLSQWIDILAAAKCVMGAMDSQPGVLTACNTMETIECDAPMESVASSPGAVAVARHTDVVWIPHEYPAPSSTQDELDLLLEELARDTSCPYLQQLTVPNLMAAMLPHSGMCAVGSELGAPPLAQPPQPRHAAWRSTGPDLHPCPPDRYEHELGAQAMSTSGTAGQMSCCAGTGTGSAMADGDVPPPPPVVVVPVVVMETRTPRSPAVATAGQASLSNMQAAGGLMAAKGGGRGSSYGGGGGEEWGENGESQLCAHALLLTRTGGPCMAGQHDAAGAAAAAAAGSTCGGSAGCCPAAPAMPYACRRRFTFSSGEQAPVASQGGCADTANVADQPSSKLWLSKSLRRLRSIVGIKGSSGSRGGSGGGSGLHKSAVSTQAACAAAAPAPSCAVAVAAAARNSSTPGLDVEDADGTLDQLCYLRGSYTGTPTATTTAADSGPVGPGVFAFHSPVMTLAAKLRALPSKRRSL